MRLELGLRPGLRLALELGLRPGLRLALELGLRPGLRLALGLGLRVGLWVWRWGSMCHRRPASAAAVAVRAAT
ncbi:hypothetical protein ABIE67_004917 [Streptomyces sp. V4I8]